MSQSVTDTYFSGFILNVKQEVTTAQLPQQAVCSLFPDCGPIPLTRPLEANLFHSMPLSCNYQMLSIV